MNPESMFIGGLITFAFILILVFAFMIGRDSGKVTIYNQAIEHGCGNYTPATSSEFKKFKWGNNVHIR